MRNVRSATILADYNRLYLELNPRTSNTLGRGFTIRNRAVDPGARERFDMPVLKPEMLDHVNIKVSDMHASMDFYTGFLGLDVASVSRDEEGEPDFVGLAAGPQTVYLSRNRDFRSRPQSYLCGR